MTNDQPGDQQVGVQLQSTATEVANETAPLKNGNGLYRGHDKDYNRPNSNNNDELLTTFRPNKESSSMLGGGDLIKNYGAVKAPPPITPPPLLSQNAKSIYSWRNIDVFGESNSMEHSSIGNLWRSTKRKLFGNRSEPVLRKQLLKNVSGIAYGGEVLAILGSSGAGKTTLLNTLAFRSIPGILVNPSAVRAINGVQVNANELQSRCAYVQQDDLFIGSLTAREHLIFQAILRMDRKIPYKEKVRRVDEVLTELSLRKCQHTLIGVTGRIKGLSGGEKKRLAFASEALTDPPLLVCDEPTSGLDSFMAHSVVQVLKGLAAKGKIIILTIHQPSSELYSLFDKLLLMAEGRVAFQGTPAESTDFFSQMNAICPSNYNPADFYIQLLAVVPGREDEARDSIRQICDTFSVSKEAQTIQDTITKYEKQNANYCLEPLDGVSHKGYRASWCTQFRAILWRSWINVVKEPMLVKVRLMQTTIVSLLIGIIFYGQTLNQDGVMNINGALFLFLTNMTFQNVFAVIEVFCGEIPVFLRESSSRLYRCDTYFLGKTVAELPLFVAIPFLFTAIAYPLIGLQPGLYHFLVAAGIVCLVANVSTSFGYLISCASSSISMALSIGPPVIIPFLLFGGFFLNTGSVPDYFTWLSYISWFRYGNEALLINQWAEVLPGDINCDRLNSTCPQSGHIILETLNFREDDLMLDVLGLIALIVVFRFFAYIALVLRTRNKD